jgi:hypothetical protein
MKKRNENKKIAKCKICLTKDFFKIKTSCNHKICIDCLTNLNKPLCPFCRNDLTNELPIKIINIINNINNINNENNENENENEILSLNNENFQTRMYSSSFSLRIDESGVHVNDLNENDDTIENMIGVGMNFLNRLF